MYQDLTQKKLSSLTTFPQEYDRLTAQLNESLKILELRGYRTRWTYSDRDQQLIISDGKGHILGSVSEPNIRPDTDPKTVESQMFRNRQVFLKNLNALSARLQADGGDQINMKTMGLTALGYTTEFTHFVDKTLVEVSNSSNGVHRLHVPNDILKGTENKTIAAWLSKLTSDILKERPDLSSRGVINS